jgi:PTH1 family peptidyl-tRNA hydrolase
MADPALPLIIVGLGNPGPKHASDRHNVGFWFADLIANHVGARFAGEQKLLGDACRAELKGRTLRLLKPATFMNRSGQSVRRLLDYYSAEPAQLLVVHDELDLPPGTARLKRGGGHGGHNGLRDIIAHCGPEFLRLRVGIGHPGHKDLVTDYVLHAPGRDERLAILGALDESVVAVEILAESSLERAMNQLHTATPRSATGEFGPAG